MPVLIAAAVLLVLAATVVIVLTSRSGSTINGHPAAAVPSPTTKPSPRPSSSPAPSSSAPTTAAATTLADIYRHEQSGVVRIETLSCDHAGIGTGFLLTPTLVATVEHVIDQAAVVSLIAGAQRTTGTVIGADPSTDLALVRASRPLTGYHFAFNPATPSVGDQVAAIGFPIGLPKTLTRGDISGLNRNVNVAGTPRTGLIQTDAALNPGNSGGPLMAADGTVVGLVDALDTQANGIAYAVPATQAASAIDTWRASPSPVPPASCPNPLGPSQTSADVPTPGQLSDGAAQGIVAAFNTYFDGINNGDYASAWAVLSPRLQNGISESAFAAGDATSYDFGFDVLSATQVDPTTAHIALAFTSLQTSAKGPGGDTCDNWSLLYTMTQNSDGSWLIDDTTGYHGKEHTAC